MMFGIGWIVGTGTIVCDVRVAGIAFRPFVVEVGDTTTAVGVGLQAVSRMTRVGIIKYLFMVSLSQDEPDMISLQEVFYPHIYSLFDG